MEVEYIRLIILDRDPTNKGLINIIAIEVIYVIHALELVSFNMLVITANKVYCKHSKNWDIQD